MALFKATIFALLVAVAIAHPYPSRYHGLLRVKRHEHNIRELLFGLQTPPIEKTGLKKEFETTKKGDEKFETPEEDDHYRLMEKVKKILERLRNAAAVHVMAKKE
ncbi:uncharacterized protein LOC125568325 [Nematostella vectensis]|uniref:uncharacterized protein LOC125568325 n=1 Tax=Nematostella vectensis TaxID=45351 RepID=UPI002076E8D9|nr:uncharacterized protein LOC125568325 [Nematostella vectensis]XP_048586280.1 uncharacterized protein LOC125568325 [Nematostella vectensis]